MSGPAGFLDLERIIVPKSLAVAANDHLRVAGRGGCEAFALWAGRRTGAVFQVLETIIPPQRAGEADGGVFVSVDSEALFRLNMHLYDRELALVAQLHSHPGEAYHSETDDTYPIATTAGALSLVIPDFAAHPFAVERCAIYRLIAGEGWVAIPRAEAARLIHLDPER
jgi:hypothetical protein